MTLKYPIEDPSSFIMEYMVSSFFVFLVFKDDKCCGKVNTQEFEYFYF